MRDDFLETLKKHIDSGAIEVAQKAVTKAQIHNFGETMKGINEFIGAIQTLNLNLAKIKNIAEKIEWINELLKTEKNENAIAMLKMQQTAHQTNVKCVYESTKFLGVSLFGTDLSCAVNGKMFSINVGNPLDAANLVEYCGEQMRYIDILLRRLNDRLNNVDSLDSLEGAKNAQKDAVSRAF